MPLSRARDFEPDTESVTEMLFAPFSAAIGRAAALVLVASAAALVLASPARAGVFQVHACDQTGINRAFTPRHDGHGTASADASCTADAGLGMRVRNSVNAP